MKVDQYYPNIYLEKHRSYEDLKIKTATILVGDKHIREQTYFSTQNCATK